METITTSIQVLLKRSSKQLMPMDSTGSFGALNYPGVRKSTQPVTHLTKPGKS